MTVAVLIGAGAGQYVHKRFLQNPAFAPSSYFTRTTRWAPVTSLVVGSSQKENVSTSLSASANTQNSLSRTEFTVCTVRTPGYASIAAAALMSLTVWG